MLLRTLQAVLLIAMPLVAQETTEVRGSTRTKPAQNPDEVSAAGGDLGKVVEGEGTKEKGKEEPSGPPAPRAATGQCRLVTSVVPKRVLPGQGGKVVVVMVMEADSVLLSPAPLTFQMQADQGPVHLSQPQFQPAKAAPAALAPAFQGRAVYADTAIFEVPFTVTSAAEMGRKYPVGIGLEFDLNLGRTGQTLGRFVDQASVEVEIGIPVPTAAGTAAPANQVTGKIGAADGDAAPGGSSTSRPAPAGTQQSSTPPLQGSIQTPTAQLPPEQKAVPDAADGSDSHGLSSQDSSIFWLAAAGGLLLLALAAVILARKH